MSPSCADLAGNVSRESISRSWTSYRSHELVIGVEEAAFEPIRGYRLFMQSLTVSVLGGGGFVAAGLGVDGCWPYSVTSLWVVGGLMIAAIFAIVMLTGWSKPRAVFNRREGRAFRTGRDPFDVRLEEIRAVQVCFGCEGGWKSRELNLVLGDGERRVNIICHGKRKALMDDAFELAHFLQIPLLDHSRKDWREGEEIGNAKTPGPAARGDENSSK